MRSSETTVIMQETSLDTNEIYMIPKFCFRTYYLNIIDEKNTLPLSKVLICYERNFHHEVASQFEDEV